jgi:hypothetical protein
MQIQVIQQMQIQFEEFILWAVPLCGVVGQVFWSSLKAVNTS